MFDRRVVPAFGMPSTCTLAVPRPEVNENTSASVLLRAASSTHTRARGVLVLSQGKEYARTSHISLLAASSTHTHTHKHEAICGQSKNRQCARLWSPHSFNQSSKQEQKKEITLISVAGTPDDASDVCRCSQPSSIQSAEQHGGIGLGDSMFLCKVEQLPCNDLQQAEGQRHASRSAHEAPLAASP